MAANGTDLPIGFKVDVGVNWNELRVRGSHDNNWNKSKVDIAALEHEKKVQIKGVSVCSEASLLLHWCDTALMLWFYVSSKHILAG